MVTPSPVGLHKDFGVAFFKSFLTILCSEIGDKTFFIAAIMAMRNPRVTVFAGALAALIVMTILSAALGWAAPALVGDILWIPKVYTHYAATALFFFFGLKSLWDVYKGDTGEESELDQVEQELANISNKKSDKDVRAEAGFGNGFSSPSKPKSLDMASKVLAMVFSQVFLKSFSLTFLAEWGDRSQIATIGLAASEEVIGVTLGGILGHAICTGAAVLGGRHLATHINERTVQVCGGLLFLAFGLHSLYIGP